MIIVPQTSMIIVLKTMVNINFPVKKPKLNGVRERIEILFFLHIFPIPNSMTLVSNIFKFTCIESIKSNKKKIRRSF